MVQAGIIFLIIFVIFIVIGLVVLTIYSLRQQVRDNDPTVDPNRPCMRATEDLIDISDLECCCLAQQPTDLRYIPKLEVVVSPGPTFYLDACAAFCPDANVNPDTEMCRTGNSDKFTACVKLTKPENCTSSAFPVAVIGTQFYYVKSATQAACPTSGACAPLPNTCPRTEEVEVESTLDLLPESFSDSSELSLSSEMLQEFF